MSFDFDFDLTAPFIPEFSGKDQAEHRHKIRAVQIVAPSSSNPGRFRLNESALNNVLGHSAIANKKVVIISVAGAFRKGKSFLLNFFLEYLYALQKYQQQGVGGTAPEWLTDDCQLHGFHWRSGAKRDTVGIWVWGEPIMIEAASGEMIQMDTQGTFDNSSTYQQCMTVFALSTIASCVQIYNVVDNIQEDALQHLSLFVEYGRLAMREAHQFGKPFQTLVFCVRDFKNPEEYEYGLDGGGRFLSTVLEVGLSIPNGLVKSEDAVFSSSLPYTFCIANFGVKDTAADGEKMRETDPDQPEEIRAVRTQLFDCFDKTLCFLLPYPGHRVAERQSFRGHVKDLRPMFREEMKKMVPQLLDPMILQPKIINGKAVTCRKMIQYLKEYVKAFDGHALPEPQGILNANAKLLCMEAAHEAKVAYCRGMDRSTSTPRMIPEKTLLRIHIQHGITAINIFDKAPRIGEPQIRSRELERLQEDINAELERYKRLNEAKRVTGCVSAMTACGDSVLLGVGLGGAAGGAVAATVLTLQTGLVSAGIVAVPISLAALFVIWTYVWLKPHVEKCLSKEDE